MKTLKKKLQPQKDRRIQDKERPWIVSSTIQLHPARRHQGTTLHAVHPARCPTDHSLAAGMMEGIHPEAHGHGDQAMEMQTSARSMSIVPNKCSTSQQMCWSMNEHHLSIQVEDEDPVWTSSR